MRLESRCYSSSAINSDSNLASTANDTFQPATHARNNSCNRNSTLIEAFNKERNANGIFSFLQKFRIANKNYFVDSTFSLSSPQSSRRSNVIDSRWQSIESVISSATATSFAFIPSHQLRQTDSAVHLLHAGREPPNPDGYQKKYNFLDTELEETRAKGSKCNRYSTGNLENVTIGYDKNFVLRPRNQENSTSHAVWIEKRKYCHKPGKRRAPQPPIEILDQVNYSKKISTYRRKKRRAPSPPKMMSSEELSASNSRQKQNDEQKEPEGVNKEEELLDEYKENTAVYNDSLKLERGVLKANKDAVETTTNESGKVSSAPVSPKPWYKRSVSKTNSKKSGKFFEKREPYRNYIDEWMLESGLPRMRRPTENGKRTSQLSMLANISALDREASEIIENERRKSREANSSVNEERFYTIFDQNGWKKEDNRAVTKKNKDLATVLNGVVNKTKITQLTKTLPHDKTLTERKKMTSEKKEKEIQKANAYIESRGNRNVLNNSNNDNDAKKPVQFTKTAEPSPCTNLIESTKKTTPTQIRPIKPFSSWTCPQCTMENPSWKFICEVCNKWRPYSVSRTQIAPVSPKEDLKLKTESPVKVENVGSAKFKTNHLETKTLSTNIFSDTLRVRQDLEKLRLARIRFFSQYQNDDSNAVNEVNSIQNKKVEQEKNKTHKNPYYNDQDRNKLRQILKELKDSLPEKSVLLGQDVNVRDKITNTWTFADIESNLNRNVDRSLTNEKVRGIEKNGDNSFKDDCSASVSKATRSDSTILSSPPSYSKETLQISSNFKNANGDLKENKKVTAIVINRLLKKLQTAIGNGQHHEAANIARELARLKVNCNVTRSIGSSSSNRGFTSLNEKCSTFAVSLYIKEKNECRGPIPLPIDVTMTMADLKLKIFDEFKISPHSQRWIFEESVITNEIKSLEEIGIDKPGTPLYLNLVTEDRKPNKIVSPEELVSIKDDKIETGSTNINVELNNMPKKVESDKNNESHFRNNQSHQSAFSTGSKPEKKEIENQASSVPSEEPTSVASSSSSSMSETKIKIGWPCDICTFINSPETNTCSVCSPVPVPEFIEDQNAMNIRNEQRKSMNYQELVALEKADLIANVERFECSICLLECSVGGGVVIRDCLHMFCRECLKQTIQFSTEAEVKCPYRDGNYSCECVLQEREIKALVNSEEYEKHLSRSITEAENKIKNAFHCKTADCSGWCIYEDNVNEFHCPVCHKTNCLTCRAIHMGLNCKQHQDLTKKDLDSSVDSSKTRNMLEEMLANGEAMVCPTCEIILMKRLGCDWLRCSMCKTEICWVTRGPRWGPNGKGDTSGGCQCGVKGARCHPKCNYCH